MSSDKTRWGKTAAALSVAVLGGLAAILQLIADGDQVGHWLSRKGDDTLERVRAERRLRVGYIPYADFTSLERDSGEVKGYLVDVLVALLPDLGIRLEDVQFIPTDWQNFATGLKNGLYDLSIAGTFRTPERERVVSFTEPLLFLGNGALVREGTEISKEPLHEIHDLDRTSLTIAAVQGEQGLEFARRHFRRAEIKSIGGADLSLVCKEVANGLAHVALSDQHILQRCVRRYPGLRDVFSGRPYLVLPIAWAVRHDDYRWRAFLNERIRALADSGFLENLRQRYPAIPFSSDAGHRLERSASEPDIAAYFRALTRGIFYTVIVSAGAIVLGTGLGALLALGLVSRRSDPLAVLGRASAWVFTYTFLAIPALVLIVVLYYNAYLSTLSSLTTAIVALGVNLAPFAGRIIANGINNISHWQIDAARALGYSSFDLATKFKFPLTARTSIQPLVVQYVTTIKLSSLASIIGVTEVLHQSQQFIRETYMTELAYLGLFMSYLVVVVPISLVTDWLEVRERRYG